VSDAIALIADLQERGIELVVTDGKLALRGPKGRLTIELIEYVKSHTPELRRRLIEEADDRGTLTASPQCVGPAGLNSSARGGEVFGDKHGYGRPGNPVLHRDSIVPEVKQELERIWPEAERLGWPQQRIWGASFWPAAGRGLAAVLEPEDRVVEVTNDFITIVKRDGTRSHFMRCNG
jgi:hypothetical protein